MENQINMSNQNSQQIGQNPVSQPVINSDKLKANYFIIGVTILIGFIIYGFGGYYLGKKSSRITQSTSVIQNQPSSVPFSSPTIDPTESWKTYTNSKYNYSFKYPSDYQIGSCRSCTDLATVDYVTIQSPFMTHNSQGYGITTVSVTNPDINKILSLQQTKIGNNINAYTETTTSYGYQTKYFYVIMSNNKVITLQYSGIGLQANINIPLEDFKDYQIFNQIVSTLKFQDKNSVDTSNWKTYSNTQYGLAFDYPQNYVVSISSDCGFIVKDQTACLLSLSMNPTASEFPPKAQFWFLKGVNSVNILGQTNGIYFDMQKKAWVLKSHFSPEETIPVWGYTKSGQEIIRAQIGGSHTSNYYYLIPNYKKDEVAIFEIPKSYRLRCDLIMNNATKQTQCNNFYKLIIDEYNGGKSIPDMWLPEKYLSSIYSEAENIVKSFREIK